ncbi:MAG: hypothetical protein JJT85_08375 [Chromatiales bacterium]|nr:hypothetical protein [Chromatiales bacterium]
MNSRILSATLTTAMLGSLALASAPAAAFSFTAIGQTFTEDFNGYRGTAATLPASFSVSWDEGRTSEPFQGINSGAFTAYTSDDVDYSFGIRERNPADLRDARLFFEFTNDTDRPITALFVSYDVEAWFVGDRRNRIRLKYDTVIDPAEAGRDTFEVDIFSTDNPAPLDTPAGTDLDGKLAENRVTVSGLVDLLLLDDGTGTAFGALLPGETAYLRWQFSNIDGDAGSLRSGLAIDNFSVTVVPVPAAVWLFLSGLGLLGYLRRRSAIA